MSTHATIIFNNENKYYAIYVHFDGYLEGVGKTLYEHYTDANKIKELFNEGDCSSLEPTISESVFYGRDHRESYTLCRVYDNEFCRKDGVLLEEEEYIYLFEGGMWWYRLEGDVSYDSLKSAFE